MPTHYNAKLAADEAMTALGEGRMSRDKRVVVYCVATGDADAGGAELEGCVGEDGCEGGVSRADVADVAARLLEVEGANGYVSPV